MWSSSEIKQNVQNRFPKLWNYHPERVGKFSSEIIPGQNSLGFFISYKSQNVWIFQGWKWSALGYWLNTRGHYQIYSSHFSSFQIRVRINHSREFVLVSSFQPRKWRLRSIGVDSVWVQVLVPTFWFWTRYFSGVILASKVTRRCCFSPSNIHQFPGF